MVHQIIKKSIVLFGMAILISSCYFSNEEDVYGAGTNCDLSTAKYSQKVSQIITDNCVSCHGPGLQSGGFRLDNYDAVKIRADNGVLLKVIKHESGVVPMPYGLPKLSDCNISVIEEWIKNGANND